MANTIKLKTYSDNTEEAVASVAVSPGHLLQRDSDGKFKPHASALGYAETLFATEDDLQGNTILTEYEIGTRVFGYHAYPGDEINALFTAAENIAIGDKLESAGDGTLQEFTSGVVVAIAIEAIASAVAGTHYAVKII